MVQASNAVLCAVDERASAGASSLGWRDRWLTLALALLFLSVTKGPLFRLRLEAAPVTVDFIDDPWVQGASVSVSLVVIVLAWPARRRAAQDRAVVTVYTVLSVVLVASTLWSVTWSRTLEQATMFVLGTVAALLAGARLGRVPVLLALWSALQVGIAASLFADLRSWPLTLDRNGDLAGIYFNRNSLGPVALLGAISSVVLAVALIRRRSGPVLAVVLVVVGVVDATVWWRSGSLTPLVSVVGATCVVAIAALFVPGPSQRPRRWLGVVLGSLVAMSLIGVVAAWSRLADVFGRSTTLSGRTTIWDVVLDFVADRPVQGWGFMAVWRQPEILNALTERDRLVYEAHSGYLEVLLGVGVIGLVSLLAVVGVVAARSATNMFSSPTVLTVFAFWAVAYAVLVNLGETYVGANLLPWTLMTVIAGQSLRTPRVIEPPLDNRSML
jgi:O-antigen ligase